MRRHKRRLSKPLRMNSSPNHTQPATQTPTSDPVAPPAHHSPLPAPPSAAPKQPEPPTTVTVQPGDSLWAITAQRLGPSASDTDVAVEWPHWYRANRRVIGSDPGLLQAGQRLVVPSNEKGRS